MSTKAEIVEMYGRDGELTGAALLYLALEHGGCSNATAESAVRPALWRAVERVRANLQQGGCRGAHLEALGRTREGAKALLDALTPSSSFGEIAHALHMSADFAIGGGTLDAAAAARCAEQASQVGTCWRSWARALVYLADSVWRDVWPEDWDGHAAEQDQQAAEVRAAYGGEYLWRPLLAGLGAKAA